MSSSLRRRRRVPVAARAAVLACGLGAVRVAFASEEMLDTVADVLA
jgi:hypothetical protein